MWISYLHADRLKSQLDQIRVRSSVVQLDLNPDPDEARLLEPHIHHDLIIPPLAANPARANWRSLLSADVLPRLRTNLNGLPDRFQHTTDLTPVLRYKETCNPASGLGPARPGCQCPRLPFSHFLGALGFAKAHVALDSCN